MVNSAGVIFLSVDTTIVITGYKYGVLESLGRFPGRVRRSVGIDYV